jgi:fructose 1,6-bisphosphate aldolase/phosphatase
MPVPINATVAGVYTLPLVSCLAFSMDKNGYFANEFVDIFADISWNYTRTKVQGKIDEWRRQGFIGPTMASHMELAYTGITETLESLEAEFKNR